MAENDETSCAQKLKQISALDLGHLTLDQQNVIRELLKKYLNIISDGNTTGRTTVVTHTIDTGTSLPIMAPQYRCSPAEDTQDIGTIGGYWP